LYYILIRTRLDLVVSIVCRSQIARIVGTVRIGFTGIIGDSERKMLLFLLVVLLFAVGWIIHLGQADRRRKVANLPGPVCPPLIGALQLMLRMNPKSKSLVKKSGS